MFKKHSTYGFVFILLSYLGSAKADTALLTVREQAAILQESGLNVKSVSMAAKDSPHQHFLNDIERAIRRANLGNDSASLRRPVSEVSIRKLQFRAAMKGNLISYSKLQPTVDYAQALLRESPKETLAAKVTSLPDQLRKPFHGNVAEYAEARARGMVLTKSRISQNMDLTEPRFKPTSYQMKIYSRPSAALSSILDDLNSKHDFIKRGIMTRDTLERNVVQGRLTKSADGSVYRPLGRKDVELEASKVFNRPAASANYAKIGRYALIGENFGSAESTSTGAVVAERLGAAGKVLGAVAVVVIVGTEIYVVRGYMKGTFSEREFATAQGGIGGGLVVGSIGGWAGMKAGAAVGLIIAGGPEDPLAAITVPVCAFAGGLIGAFGGGYVGSKLGESGSSLYYDHLDEKQKQEVTVFIFKHYGVIQ